MCSIFSEEPAPFAIRIDTQVECRKACVYTGQGDPGQSSGQVKVEVQETKLFFFLWRHFSFI
jgi:hypothetical protein